MFHRRTKAYRRFQRQRIITRKKSISQAVYSRPWYDVDGKFDKGKIHCSCYLCTGRTSNRKGSKRGRSFSDIRRIAREKIN